jgi:hypothetical protein
VDAIFNRGISAYIIKGVPWTRSCAFLQLFAVNLAVQYRETIIISDECRHLDCILAHENITLRKVLSQPSLNLQGLCRLINIPHLRRLLWFDKFDNVLRKFKDNTNRLDSFIHHVTDTILVKYKFCRPMHFLLGSSNYYRADVY